ncbi:MAG: copper amine oxidase N-terminal domain-containing protein, partial [Clostridiales bacterium]|nr:copper amine oxidase N-terminal domain-containing protein [Clostridiales bacterium]
MKRLTALLLSLTLALGAPSLTLAASGKKSEKEPLPPAIIPAYTLTAGTIQSIDTGNRTVTIVKADGGETLLLNMGRNPVILDSATQGVLNLRGLKEGAFVHVWHRPILTASLPAQTPVLALLTNAQSGGASAVYFEVEAVFRSGNTYSLLNQPQDLMLSMDRSIKMKKYGGGTERISAMKPGAAFVAWYDSSVEGSPATAATHTVVTLPYAYDGYFLVDRSYININGYMLNGRTIKHETGELLAPVLEAAKRMGLRAVYSRSAQTLVVRRGNNTLATFMADGVVHLADGQELYTTAPQHMDGEVYVSLHTFLSLFNYKV